MQHSFFLIKHNARVYGYLAVPVARNVPFVGALAAAQRQSKLKISEANAEAKLPECTACPVLAESASFVPYFLMFVLGITTLLKIMLKEFFVF